jgi:hypothetical protein
LTIFTIDASAPTNGAQFIATLYLLLKRGRFVRIPHQLFATGSQGAALVCREKRSHLRGRAVEGAWSLTAGPCRGNTKKCSRIVPPALPMNTRAGCSVGEHGDGCPST